MLFSEQNNIINTDWFICVNLNISLVCGYYSQNLRTYSPSPGFTTDSGDSGYTEEPENLIKVKILQIKNVVYTCEDNTTYNWGSGCCCFCGLIMATGNSGKGPGPGWNMGNAGRGSRTSSGSKEQHVSVCLWLPGERLGYILWLCWDSTALSRCTCMCVCMCV